MDVLDIDQVGLDEMGVDEMVIRRIGIRPNGNSPLVLLLNWQVQARGGARGLVKQSIPRQYVIALLLALVTVPLIELISHPALSGKS